MHGSSPSYAYGTRGALPPAIHRRYPDAVRRKPAVNLISHRQRNEQLALSFNPEGCTTRRNVRSRMSVRSGPGYKVERRDWGRREEGRILE